MPSGYLKIYTYTADKALPVGDSKAVIYSTTNNVRTIITTIKVDDDGISEIIELPSVNKNLSLSPKDETPYTKYDVEVSHPNYMTNYFKDVPIFPNIITIQNVPMQLKGTNNNMEIIVDSEPNKLL